MKRTICAVAALGLFVAAAPGCSKKQGEQAEDKAAAAVEEAVKQAAAGGQGGEAARSAQAEVGKALAEASKALGAAGASPAGDVVNWRKLEPLLPAKLGSFEADGELKGATNAMGAMKISTVKRSYKAGDRRLRAEIADAWLVPMLRSGFAMAQLVKQDSSEGVKKGVKVSGQPGLLEWRKARKRGKLTILIADRFLLKLSLEPSEEPDEVVKLAADLALDKLAKLKAD